MGSDAGKANLAKLKKEKSLKDKTDLQKGLSEVEKAIDKGDKSYRQKIDNALKGIQKEKRAAKSDKEVLKKLDEAEKAIKDDSKKRLTLKVKK